MATTAFQGENSEYKENGKSERRVLQRALKEKTKMIHRIKKTIMKLK